MEVRNCCHGNGQYETSLWKIANNEVNFNNIYSKIGLPSYFSTEFEKGSPQKEQD